MSAPAERDRPSSLRAFQQQLTRRLQQAGQAPASATAAVAVSTPLGGWLFDTAQLAEIIALPEIAPVPLTRPWYLGLFLHRSQLTGVIDLDAFAGAAPVEALPTGRLLRLAPMLTISFRCAIRVMRVHAMVDYARWQVLPREPGRPAWVVATLEDPQGRRWTHIDAAVLVRDPAFLDIGA